MPPRGARTTRTDDSGNAFVRIKAVYKAETREGVHEGLRKSGLGLNFDGLAPRVPNWEASWARALSPVPFDFGAHSPVERLRSRKGALERVWKLQDPAVAEEG